MCDDVSGRPWSRPRSAAASAGSDAAAARSERLPVRAAVATGQSDGAAASQRTAAGWTQVSAGRTLSASSRLVGRLSSLQLAEPAPDVLAAAGTGKDIGQYWGLNPRPAGIFSHTRLFSHTRGGGADSASPA